MALSHSNFQSPFLCCSYMRQIFSKTACCDSKNQAAFMGQSFYLSCICRSRGCKCRFVYWQWNKDYDTGMWLDNNMSMLHITVTMTKETQGVLYYAWLKYLCKLDNSVIQVLVAMWHGACSEHVMRNGSLVMIRATMTEVGVCTESIGTVSEYKFTLLLHINRMTIIWLIWQKILLFSVLIILRRVTGNLEGC